MECLFLKLRKQRASEIKHLAQDHIAKEQWIWTQKVWFWKPSTCQLFYSLCSLTYTPMMWGYKTNFLPDTINKNNRRKKEVHKPFTFLWYTHREDGYSSYSFLIIHLLRETHFSPWVPLGIIYCSIEVSQQVYFGGSSECKSLRIYPK